MDKYGFNRELSLGCHEQVFFSGGGPAWAQPTLSYQAKTIGIHESTSSAVHFFPVQQR
jgi:hypothetical protein